MEQTIKFRIADSAHMKDAPERIFTVRGYGRAANADLDKTTSAFGTYSPFGNASIDFSNKLIIVDGKEATEKQLKKIALSDIKSMQTLQGRQAINKYGEKAKGGVLVVVTKK